MNAFSSAIVLIFGWLLLIIIFGGLLAIPIMWLWNICLVPAVPMIQEIGWLQAWGLLILFNILFKTVVTKKD